MSIQAVRAYFAPLGRAEDILEFPVSSATVELAAQAVGVEPARIAKTLSFKDKDGSAILICCAGDCKVDNRKYKDQFGTKAKMLTPDEALASPVTPWAASAPSVCPRISRCGYTATSRCSASAPCSPPVAAPIPPSSSPARSWPTTPTAWSGSMSVSDRLYPGRGCR